MVAAKEEGRNIGRIRMRRITDASAASVIPFVCDSIEPGSVVHTDGWLGYEPVERNGYRHGITFLRGQAKSPSDLLPRVHRVIALLKRWLLGTHQGAVSLEHLDYYLDEFTFRFNRRRSREANCFPGLSSRPWPSNQRPTPQLSKPKGPNTTCRSYLSQVDIPN